MRAEMQKHTCTLLTRQSAHSAALNRGHYVNPPLCGTAYSILITDEHPPSLSHTHTPLPKVSSELSIFNLSECVVRTADA